jgi:hypothetical protein
MNGTVVTTALMDKIDLLPEAYKAFFSKFAVYMPKVNPHLDVEFLRQKDDGRKIALHTYGMK